MAEDVFERFRRLRGVAPKGAVEREALQVDVPAVSASVIAVDEGTEEESFPTVGDWVLLLSADGIQQNTTPYRVKTIEQGPDGHIYARFAETTTGWPLAHCEKTEPLSPAAAFDALEEEMLGGLEEVRMRKFFLPPTPKDTAPSAGEGQRRGEGHCRTALALLQQLHTLGGVLVPYPDGTLRYKAPNGVLTPELLAAMRQQKVELHALVEDWSERAAFAEYCGGLPRPEAEKLAWQLVLGGNEQ